MYILLPFSHKSFRGVGYQEPCAIVLTKPSHQWSIGLGCQLIGVLQANRDFTHDKFIDGVVTVLVELLDKYWVPRESHTGKVLVPPQSSSTSTAGSIPSTGSTTPSTVLPGNPLPRLPLIRIPGTSSTSSSKRRLENEDKSGSRLPKRRSPVGETTHPPSAGASGSGSVVVPSPAISWTKIDIPSSPHQTIHHPPSAPL